MRRGLLLLPLLAIVPLLWLLLESDDALDLDPVASAATLTSDAGSARIAFETKMKLQSRTIEFDGEGLFDFEDANGRITTDASPLLPGASGDNKIEMRTVGSKIFIRMPTSISGQGFAAGRWVSFDIKRTLKSVGLGSFDPTNLQQDPTQILSLLRSSATSVKQAGKATVRGTPTTRYTATLDLTKALEAGSDELGLSKEQRELAHKAAEQIAAQTGVKTLPVEVFVDPEGRLRRMRVGIKATTGPSPFSVTQTTDYYDFGVDVDVEAPPESQVLDLTPRSG